MIKLEMGKVGELGGGPKQETHIVINISELEKHSVNISILNIFNSAHHIKHEVSVCLLVLGAVEPVPVGAPQKRPAVPAEFLEQTALPTQAGDHYVGDPINSI